MRKLIYYVAVSIDGFIAAPDGQTDFFLAEGDHMPWIIDAYPETIPGHFRAPLGLTETPPRQFDTVLMGRATHQIAVDEGLASGYPHLRQYVFTRRPGELPTEVGLSASADDPVAVVRELKSEESPLDIWLCGGGALAATLLEEIDEFRLKVNPLVLGAGIPLIATAAAKATATPAPDPRVPGASVAAEAGDPGGRSAGFARLSLRRRMSRDFESGVTYTEYARA